VKEDLLALRGLPGRRALPALKVLPASRARPVLPDPLALQAPSGPPDLRAK
jgi:hypothetical protein